MDPFHIAIHLKTGVNDGLNNNQDIIQWVQTHIPIAKDVGVYDHRSPSSEGDVVLDIYASWDELESLVLE